MEHSECLAAIDAPSVSTAGAKTPWLAASTRAPASGGNGSAPHATTCCGAAKKASCSASALGSARDSGSDPGGASSSDGSGARQRPCSRRGATV